MNGFRGGDVFAFGATTDGCLGIGYKKENFNPTPEPVVTHWMQVDDLMAEGGAGGGEESSGIMKADGKAVDEARVVTRGLAPLAGEYAQLEEVS